MLRASAVAACAVGALALAVLITWPIGSRSLEELWPDTVPITVAAAVGLLLAAAALVVDRWKARRPTLALALSLAPGVVGAAALLARAAGWDVGAGSGEMAPGVAFGLIASAAALTLRLRAGATAHRISQGIALALAVGSLLALVVLIWKTDHSSGTGHPTEIAAVVGLLTLGLAIAGTTPDVGAARHLARVGGWSGAGRVLRAALLGVLLVAWLDLIARLLDLAGGDASPEILSEGTAAALLIAAVLAAAAIDLTKADGDRARAEDELRAAAIRVRQLYDEAPCGYQSFDRDGLFTEVNHTTCQWLGYERDELIGKLRLADLVAEEDRAEARRYMEQLLRDGGTAEREFEITRRDGTRMPVIMTGRLVSRSEDGAEAVRTTLSDTTERVVAAHGRLVADRRYRRIVETAQEGVWAIDAESRTSFVNARMVQMLGYTPEEMIGRPLFDFMDEEGRAIAAANAERRREGIAEQQDFKFLRKDGAELWAIVSTNPFVEGDGAYGGALAMVTDITERRAAEHALRASERRLQSIIDESPSVIFIKDLDLRYILVNREFERFFGRPREELIGRTEHELFPLEVSDEVEAWDRRVLAKPGAVEYEARFPRHGVDRTYLTTKFQLVDARGRAAGVCGMATDITERKTIEETTLAMNRTLEERVAERTAKLEAANQDLASFSYSVAHDLRGPVRTMHGFSSILMDEHRGELRGEARRYLELVQQGASEMARIIDDLLVFARLGQQALHVEEVDPARVAREALQELRAADEVGPAEVVIRKLPRCRADSRLLHHVFVNLLSNALKFSRGAEEPRVVVEAAEDHGKAAYVVRDSGVGFDQAYAGKLFGVFERLHTSDEFEGTGLGLAIVHRIVQRHGGSVWAEGRVGEGASFFFTLD